MPVCSLHTRTNSVLRSARRRNLENKCATPDSETRVDDRIKQLLRDLGTAINESISGSDDVSKQIQRIRDEGYNLYVVLDATIGLNKQDEEGEQHHGKPQPQPTAEMVVSNDKEVQFRININDLSLLRALGIDPTRKVRTTRRVEPLAPSSDE